jgi:hypothetical protein
VAQRIALAVALLVSVSLAGDLSVRAEPLAAKQHVPFSITRGTPAIYTEKEVADVHRWWGYRCNHHHSAAYLAPLVTVTTKGAGHREAKPVRSLPKPGPCAPTRRTSDCVLAALALRRLVVRLLLSVRGAWFVAVDLPLGGVSAFLVDQLFAVPGLLFLLAHLLTPFRIDLCSPRQRLVKPS